MTQTQHWITCPKCDGTGSYKLYPWWIEARPCRMCRGRGQLPKPEGYDEKTGESDEDQAQDNGS